MWQEHFSTLEELNPSLPEILSGVRERPILVAMISYIWLYVPRV